MREEGNSNNNNKGKQKTKGKKVQVEQRRSIHEQNVDVVDKKMERTKGCDVLKKNQHG